jgi:exocyst complex component 5
VRRAETHHNNHVMAQGRKMEQLLASFNRVDAALNAGGSDGDANGSSSGGGGGTLAQRIGERLEELERQRQRAQDAKGLLMCWLEVSERGSLGTLETLKRRAGGDGKVRSAALARQLLKISQRLEADDGAAEVNGGVNGRHHQGRARNAAPQTGYPARELIEKFLEGLETDLLKQFDLHYRRQNYEGMKVWVCAGDDFR